LLPLGGNDDTVSGSNHFDEELKKICELIRIISCPVLRDCHTFGSTIDEAMANIKEAIELCFVET
jgi:hypothetical protein